MRGGRRAPLTLRDFLELACESSSDGFRSYPRSCDAGAPQQQQKPAARPHVVEHAELSRSPSWSPSAFFSFPGNKSPLARISSLSRSFSRRISFWRRHRDDLDDDRDSCGFPSPLVSSCSSSSSSSELLDIVIEETSSAAPVAAFQEPSAEAMSSSNSTTGAAGNGQDEALDACDPAVGRRKLETMEDKQQLSPVSVLDFPFDDDDGDEEERSDAGTCSPSSFQRHHNCAAANLQRKKTKKAQHKIRRFDDGPTTEAADLESRFTTTTSDSGGESVDDTHLPSKNNDDSEAAKTPAPCRGYEEEHQKSTDEQSQGQDEDAYRLLARLLEDGEIRAAAMDEITEWLLLDFFAEGIARLFRSSSVVGTTTANKALPDDVNNKATAALLDTATDWLLGAGPQWGIGDVMFSGESALKDMERSRRWMCVREEEHDVGEELEVFLMDRLLDELVAELALPLVVRRYR